ncbi:MAG: peptide-methionine (S)-S-oxide reductase, partial [Polymorphobacter sp.]
MFKRPDAIGVAMLAAAALVAFQLLPAATVAARVVPAPLVDAPRDTKASSATAVLAGGCFWGVEAVFEHVAGVTAVQSGYAGGSAATANYQIVGSGLTGHAEA